MNLGEEKIIQEPNWNVEIPNTTGNPPNRNVGTQNTTGNLKTAECSSQVDFKQANRQTMKVYADQMPSTGHRTRAEGMSQCEATALTNTKLF